VVTDSDPTTAGRPERRRRERYGVLLGAIIIAFAIQGIAEPSKWEQILMTVLLGVTLLLAFFAADAKPIVIRAAALVVAALILASIGEAASGSVDGGATRIADALLVLLAPPAIVIGVVRSLRARQAVTLEAVFGVLCVYILVGMFFAYTYGSINHLGGSPFFAGDQPATVARCLYFSFASLTTVGYGDLTARSNLGHTLSVSEALLGQVYLVTVVSLIVANLGRSTPAARSQ
jgi:Ion channel